LGCANHLPRDSSFVTTDEVPEFLPLRFEQDLADPKVLAEPKAGREVVERRGSTVQFLVSTLHKRHRKLPFSNGEAWNGHLTSCKERFSWNGLR
jgi:hypothetical protein